ncbi:hypothetical protein ACF0H5_024499 [Mactra antiquata]
MFRIIQVILFLICYILYHATGITVDECTSTEVVFTVTDGVAGGKAFIEGTGVTDTECFPDLDGSSSQTLVMRYSACGVTPTELSFGTIIEFVIIVQDSPIINTISDDRYAVECSFGETTDTINVELLTSSTSPLNYIQKPFAITPKPVMFLYYTVNDSLVNNNVVPLGTEVSLKITIDQLIRSIGNDVTGYEIGENDICMEETSFYGVIFSLLALLIASWAFMCCIFMFMRRRRRKDSKTITVVDSSATKISTLTPSPEKPIKTVPIALPRYFPVTVGSFSDRSGSA